MTFYRKRDAHPLNALIKEYSSSKERGTIKDTESTTAREIQQLAIVI